MDFYTSHNDLADLLEPRQISGWHGGVVTLWDRKLHVLSGANFAYEHSLEEIEEDYWRHCFQSVETKLKLMNVKPFHSWAADGKFFKNIMSPIQMELYLPSFYQIVKLMPRQMLGARRKILARYMDLKLLDASAPKAKWSKWFIRSAPLLYPAHELVARADRFTATMRFNADQGRAAQKSRTVAYIRYITRMSDKELIGAFSHQDSYERELEWLLVLSRDFKLTLEDIFTD
ncbi:hypothetical protein GUA87_14815 [Sneathiella sp. P13V-1]|uniref:hypothetical protein n=1 Tax=Sneathiella sp. P13V-1 TaxID=2697366 RepID=UPI00187B71BC|nr:hypothetical protein [Sneathiella sp. P13V-1]MBE7638127.1 hypothetical protein [Sneathiella sp. P13V-1]